MCACVRACMPQECACVCVCVCVRVCVQTGPIIGCRVHSSNARSLGRLGLLGLLAAGRRRNCLVIGLLAPRLVGLLALRLVVGLLALRVVVSIRVPRLVVSLAPRVCD